MKGSAACRHETLPDQWRALAPKAVPVKIGQAKAFACLRPLIVARFGCKGKPDNTWKSRIFNNLGPTLVTVRRLPSESIASPTPETDAGPPAGHCRPCGMRRAYDSHSPR